MSNNSNTFFRNKATKKTLKNLTAMRRKKRERKVVKIEKVASKNDMTVLGVQRRTVNNNDDGNNNNNDDGNINNNNDNSHQRRSNVESSPLQTYKIVDDPFKVKVGYGWSTSTNQMWFS